GLLGLTRCVALEGAPHGVTCVMISPTWVETELMRRNVAQVVAREGKGRAAEDVIDEFRRGNPQGRMMQPEEIAALAVFLCSDLAKGITMENIQITGGALWWREARMAPAFAGGGGSGQEQAIRKKGKPKMNTGNALQRAG